MRVLLNRQNAVVALLVFPGALLSLDDTYRATLHYAAWKRGFVHEDEHVYRIAVVREGRRRKSKVVWKLHPGRQDFLQFENALLRIEGELVATALRRLNHDAKQLLVLLIEGSKPTRVRQTIFLGHIVRA